MGALQTVVGTLLTGKSLLRRVETIRTTPTALLLAIHEKTRNAGNAEGSRLAEGAIGGAGQTHSHHTLVVPHQRNTSFAVEAVNSKIND